MHERIPTDADLLRRKRRLRLRLGRARRRIDRRIRSTEHRGRELLHWRTYARRYPGNIVLGTFGLGLALSAGLGARGLSRWLGLRLFRRAASEGERLLGEELRWLWTASTPKTDDSSADDSRSTDGSG